jgi:hypothetical protein
MKNSELLAVDPVTPSDWPFENEALWEASKEARVACLSWGSKSDIWRTLNSGVSALSKLSATIGAVVARIPAVTPAAPAEMLAPIRGTVTTPRGVTLIITAAIVAAPTMRFPTVLAARG